MQKTTLLIRHRLLLLSLLTLFGIVSAAAQSVRNRFTLIGTINRQTGTVQLIPIGHKGSHPATTGTYQTTISNGRFTVTGEAPYPLGFLIASFPEYVSNPFLVEAGRQTIRCNADSIREIPSIDNRSMRELQNAPINFFAAPSGSTQRKMQLLEYVKQHPASYVGLWETVRQLGFGYDPLLDSTYWAFNPVIRKTHTGTDLAKRLAASSVTATGKPFPAVPLLTLNNQSIKLASFGPARYTLVDFWFSRCGACIDEFPKLKSLFSAYKQAGFNIVQISIDKKAEMALWRKTIQQHGLPWTHYLDESGKFTIDTLSIDAFPANFLVDEQGHILRKDIRPIELEKFLTKMVSGPDK